MMTLMFHSPCKVDFNYSEMQIEALTETLSAQNCLEN
jgi:hypothetical protein